MLPIFLFPSPQDKLTKSLTYILGNQDTVQTQICKLEETVRHTEVREGTGRVQKLNGRCGGGRLC